jgi:hypothetical protein
MGKSVRSSLGVFLVAGLAAPTGCDSGPDKVAVYPVRGQVLYDGKPAAGVQVFFYPTSAPAVPEIPANPHGVTGPDGRFTLTTFTDGDGAAPGGYQVILYWPAETAEDEEASKEDRLLGWYSAVHSKLTVDVKAGDNDLPRISLPARKGPPGKSEGVPGRN